MTIALTMGTSSHGGLIQGTCTSVLIEGHAPIVHGDTHLCPLVNPGPSPHPPHLMQASQQTVFAEGKALVETGNTWICGGQPCSWSQGSVQVMMQNQSPLEGISN